MSGAFEQGGLWYGQDEDNYVKVVLISRPEGAFVHSLIEVLPALNLCASNYEERGATRVSQRDLISLEGIDELTLSIYLNSRERTIQTSFTTNGSFILSTIFNDL